MADIAPQEFGSLDEKFRIRATIITTFTPGTAVRYLDLLAGREEQINKILEAVLSPGQHAAIYGERGVGKSSLGNLIYDIVQLASGEKRMIPVSITCSANMTFPQIWAEVFRQIERATGTDGLLMSLPDHDLTSEDIRSILSQVEKSSLIVIDEYDRISESVAVDMADAIKTISDRAISTTLILVGVADTIDQLIVEHSSIDRALIQIPMPRMSRDELIDIIKRGMGRLTEFTLEAGLDQRMADISKGLPHFMHLLAKHSFLSALDDNRRIVTRKDYEKALKTATEEKSQSLGQAYRKATHSAMDSIFEEVLLACALATDEHGFFGAKDVRVPLSRILGKQIKIEGYIRHLDKFSKEERGRVLKKEGQKRKFQYSFVEPMMQPYVLMKGLAEKRITEDDLSVLSTAPRQPSLIFEQEA